MNQQLKMGIRAFYLLALLWFVLFAGSVIVHAETNISAHLTVNRADGTCQYTVSGIDLLKDNLMTMNVTRLDNSNQSVTALTKEIILTDENCSNHTYTDTFSMSDLNEFQYAEYFVTFQLGTETITADNTCDFTVHAEHWTLNTDDKTGAAEREITFAVDDSSSGVYKPGTGNEISIYVWKKGTPESSAVLAGEKQNIADATVSWTVDMSKIVDAYGTYYAKAVLTNTHDSSISETAATTHFIVQPSAASFTTKVTNALEAKQSFRVNLQGVENLFGVKKVTFSVYNSSGKKVYSCTGKDENGSGKYFYADITMKSLGYKLDNYTVKATITDKKGSSKLVSSTTAVDRRAKAGTLKVTNNADKIVKFSLKEAYLPGKIKSVKYCVFAKADGTSKSQLYNAAYVSSTDNFAATMKVTDFKYKKTGTYIVYAYGYTQWGTKVLLNKSSFKITKATAAVTGGNPSNAKGTFTFTISEISSPSGVSSMTVKVWKSGETKDAHTYTAAKQSNGTYKVTVNAANHQYHFGTYHARISITMGNGIKVTAGTGSYSFKPSNFVYLGETNVKNCKKVYIYNPSKSGKITFQVYSKANGTDDSATYNAVTNGNYSYSLIKIANIKSSGTIYVKAKIGGTVVRTFTFTLKKGELLKNGWYYEKYNGKTYKFYYENGEKVTDLTKILGIKESSNSNYNNFYVEINRAANCVTIYAYDTEKKSYCIPIKTCTVSIGRDTWSTKDASGLATDTSFTPLGTYSVSSNGTSVKYTMKPMYEPDGSTVYARWATHVVGNVYFHSVAVGANSHYALSATQYNRLGTAASAGCIRMTVADAKWIYDYVSKGTKVTILKGDANHPGPLGKNATIKISSSVSYDPTDPDVPLSTKQKDYKAGRISGYMKADGTKVGY